MQTPPAPAQTTDKEGLDWFRAQEKPEEEWLIRKIEGEMSPEITLAEDEVLLGLELDGNCEGNLKELNFLIKIILLIIMITICLA